jgi:uncharacterized protein YecE (DUF72 family)
VRERFPPASCLLQRHAAVLPAVEINSSLYRPHRAETYARWAAVVPGQFRFAVKLPRSLTHESRLVGGGGSANAEGDLMRLVDEVAGVEGEAWCILDNTAAGAATGQALDLMARRAAKGLS